MTTLNRDWADVLRAFRPNAVTDVTGFGLFGHAYETAERSGVRLVLEADAAPPRRCPRGRTGGREDGWRRTEPRLRRRARCDRGRRRRRARHARLGSADRRRPARVAPGGRRARAPGRAGGQGLFVRRIGRVEAGRRSAGRLSRTTLEHVHVETTRLSRLRAFELSPTTFRWLAGLSVAALWLIVSTGAVVRLTSSGLGCEHWPGCQPGQPFPAKGYHSYIEFGNRMVASVTIVLTLALAIGAWLTRGLPRWARWLAVGTFAGTVAQAPLGAITVYAHLHPALVIPHLLLSIAVLGAAVDPLARGARPRSRTCAGHWTASRASPDLRSHLPASGFLPPERLRPPPDRTLAARTCTGCGDCIRRCSCTVPPSQCSAAASCS